MVAFSIGGLARQQGPLSAQPAHGVGLGQQALAFRQVDDHGGGDKERQQGRFAGQVVDLHDGAAPFGERVHVRVEGHLDGAHQGRRGVRVDGLFGQRLDLTLQVRQALIEGQEPEPAGADGHDVEPPVGVLLYPAQGRGAADLVERLHPLHAGLPALADRDHAEPPGIWPVQQVPDELPVTFLEDVQRQQHARDRAPRRAGTTAASRPYPRQYAHAAA